MRVCVRLSRKSLFSLLAFDHIQNRKLQESNRHTSGQKVKCLSVRVSGWVTAKQEMTDYLLLPQLYCQIGWDY